MTTGKRKSRPGHGGNLPSEAEIIEFVETQSGRVGKREISRAFNIKGPQRVALKQLLKRMAEAGQIAGSRRELHKPGALPPVTVLEIVALDEDGEPVAVPVKWDDADGAAPRALVLAEQKKPHHKGKTNSRPPGIGERVLARLSRSDGRSGHSHAYEARVIKRLEARPQQVFGVYRKTGDGGLIESVDKKFRHDIVVAPGDEGGAKPGELVGVELMKGRSLGPPRGRVAERIAPVDSHKALSAIAIAEFGLPNAFPADVLADAAALKDPDLSHHRDLRDVPLITIDPADARDHDDAVWARAGKDGFETIVAIADVSLYVRSGSAIDAEARLRGNSVYFPDRVVPMLPERLSTDLCSLREGEDRPALCVRMHFDADGNKTSHEFFRAIIRSAAKLSYQQAQAAIDGTVDNTTRPLLAPVLKPLWAAYAALAKARDERGPLDLDLPERRIVLNDAGNVAAINTPARLDAHRLVEEFMIQANVSAAQSLAKKEAPAIHRLHDVPSEERTEGLNEMLESLDLKLARQGAIKAANFNRLLAKARGKDVEHLLSMLILRSQAQAIYSAGESGHFGLNLKDYVHFTSPIRRYADLVVHRSLVTAFGLGPGGMAEPEAEKLGETSEHISTTERRAMSAERATIDRLTAAFLADRIGARFNGRIAGLTGAGLFIELDETGADGFVPISTMTGDYYFHDEKAHRLRGERTGESFALGDAVEVRLREASATSGALRLELLSGGRMEDPKKGPPRRGRPKHRHRRRGKS